YVLDPSLKPIPRAEVSVIQSESGFARTAATDATGFYLLTGLHPAVYSISAKAEGFESPSATVLRLAVNTKLRADLELAVAGLRQSVEAPAVIQLVPSDSSELGMVFDQARIQSLPLNRRDFLQLALLAPGVAPAVQDSELSTR